jgi:hypothetical protein
MVIEESIPKKNQVNDQDLTQVTLASVHMIHSPRLAALRKESMRLISERLAPLSAAGKVDVVSANEPESIVSQVSKLADVNASHVEDAGFRAHIRNMHIRQLSNALKHRAALETALEAMSGSGPGSRFRFSLIVEDDALFSDNVARLIKQTVRDAPPDSDIVFLGLPSKNAPTDGVSTFDDAIETFELLPACDAYLVSLEGARKLLADFLPVRFCTNVHLTYLARKNGIRSYVAVPNVFVDGSKLGVFTSSLDPNNRLIWNRDFCRLEALVRAKEPVPDGEFEAAWASQPFKEHPNVVALRAEHLARAGKHRDAEELFATALDAFDRGEGIVSNASDFLRRYISLYAHLQQL